MTLLATRSAYTGDDTALVELAIVLTNELVILRINPLALLPTIFIYGDDAISCLVLGTAIRKPMYSNLDVFVSCIDRSIGSWAATAVNEATTGGASAGVATAGALDQLRSIHQFKIRIHTCISLQDSETDSLMFYLVMAFY